MKRKVSVEIEYEGDRCGRAIGDCVFFRLEYLDGTSIPFCNRFGTLNFVRLPNGMAHGVFRHHDCIAEDEP